MSSPINVGPIPGFPDARRIGTLQEDLQKWKHNWLKQAKSKDPQPIQISAEGVPIMMCSEDVKAAYQNANYEKIESIENKAMEDLQSVDDNIKVHGFEAFIKVSYEGGYYFLSYSETASVWIYNLKTEKIGSNGKGTVYNFYYQIGKYSGNGGVTATTSIVFQLADESVSNILPGLVATFMQTVLAQSKNLDIDHLHTSLAEFAQKNGVVVTINISRNSAMINGILFVLIFTGILLFYDWPIQKFTIELRIYNWSNEHELSVSKCFCDNVKMICDEQDQENACEVVIPKLIPEGSEIMPPGFNPPFTIKGSCSYVNYLFKNDKMLLVGCGISVKFEIDRKDSGEGFMYAFDCPPINDNKQKAEPVLKDPKEYYKEDNWAAKPLEFSIKTNKDQIPVLFKLDALNGIRFDDIYKPVISFNNE